MKRPMIPSIPVEVLETLLGMNNNARKIALAVFSNIMINEADLALSCKIKIDNSNFEYAFKKLKQLNIVNRYIDENHVIWYTVHSKLLMQYMACQQCQYRKKKVYRASLNSAHYFQCKAMVLCAFNYYRVAHALLKQYKARHGLELMADDFRVTRKNTKEYAREYNNKPVDSWITKDFVEYIMDYYETQYPHIETPKKPIVHRYFAKIKLAFETEFEDKWQYVAKHYIKYNFEKAREEHYTVSVKMMTEPRLMNEYLEARPFVEEVEVCGKYDIRCPYWEDGCTLKARGGECTKKIRSHMRGKYN